MMYDTITGLWKKEIGSGGKKNNFHEAWLDISDIERQYINDPYINMLLKNSFKRRFKTDVAMKLNSDGEKLVVAFKDLEEMDYNDFINLVEFIFNELENYHNLKNKLITKANELTDNGVKDLELSYAKEVMTVKYKDIILLLLDKKVFTISDMNDLHHINERIFNTLNHLNKGIADTIKLVDKNLK